jgi:Fe-S cluster assembly iron-binding protein IscA
LPGIDYEFNFPFEADGQDSWFQQDGATVHIENSTKQMLSEFFGGQILS